MKIHILGRGLAAMGVLEALLSKLSGLGPNVSINWIGPAIGDHGWRNCSRNSTAVVALHGIKKGVSPLGDDLVDAYEDAVEFFKKNSPAGVESCARFHFVNGDAEKMENRFGEIQELNIQGRSFAGVREEALVYRPLVFLKWWEDRLIEKFNAGALEIQNCEDVIVSTDKKCLVGLKSTYSLNTEDLIFDCRGSGVNELASADIKLKRAPGHYLVWEGEGLGKVLGKDSWVYTMSGHNLIFHAKESRLILGGSTEDEGIEAKSFIDLEKQRRDFLKSFQEFEDVLQMDKAKVLTGMRPKAPKRRPLLEKNGQTIVINGFYKNGYSLCYLYGKKALELI